MFRLKSKFERELRKHARQLAINGNNDGRVIAETASISAGDTDEFGFPKSEASTLAYLGALIMSQAERDGASGVRFHYGTNRMFYTVGGISYEMVPPPAPLTVDLAKGLARVAKTCFEKAGSMTLSFYDKTLSLSVRHGGDVDDRYIELTGFSGSQIQSAAAQPELACVTQVSER